MVQQLQPESSTGIVYPDSDGQPMADNTLQFEWIVTIKENLERVFTDSGSDPSPDGDRANHRSGGGGARHYGGAGRTALGRVIVVSA